MFELNPILYQIASWHIFFFECKQCHFQNLPHSIEKNTRQKIRKVLNVMSLEVMKILAPQKVNYQFSLVQLIGDNNIQSVISIMFKLLTKLTKVVLCCIIMHVNMHPKCYIYLYVERKRITGKGKMCNINNIISLSLSLLFCFW